MKVAIFVFADREGRGEMGRAVNALIAAKEFAGAGDEVRIYFDGAGVQWPGILGAAEHPYHGLYAAVKGKTAGVCAYCAKAFGVTDRIEAEGLPFARDFEDHPSFRSLLAEGWQVLTF